MTSLVRAVERGGLHVLTVETADLKLGFLPAVGGRLVSVSAGGQEFLWRDPAMLDADLHPVSDPAAWPDGGGEFTVEVVEEPGVVEIVLTSAADEVTGLTVTRTFRIPGRGVSFVQMSQFRNSSDRTLQWTAREVVHAGPTSDGRALTVSPNAVPGGAPTSDTATTSTPQADGRTELELTGPSTTLPPGGSTALHLHWSV